MRETLALRPHLEDSFSMGEVKSLSGHHEGQDMKSEQDQSAIGEDGATSGDKLMTDEHGSGSSLRALERM